MAYYRLYETSLDITRLHPLVVVGVHFYLPLLSRLYFFFQICWYLAAVVQIQLCKYFIEIGDVSRETTIWGEINILRYVSTLSSLCKLNVLTGNDGPFDRSAMMAYGERSPIGSELLYPVLGLARY